MTTLATLKHQPTSILKRIRWLVFAVGVPVVAWGFGLPGDVAAFLALVLLLLPVAQAIMVSSPEILRPDVLSNPRNRQLVAQALAFKEEGVFCGEILSGLSGSVGKQRQSLYVSPEDRGVVIGPPGTGKTAFMVSQLIDRIERGGSFVCLDIKPELHGILKDRLQEAGYRALVFNPTDPVDRYNLLDDLHGPTAIGELAYSLIPSANADNKAFDEAARDLLDGIISFLKAEGRAVSLPSIRQFIGRFSSEQELIQTLSDSDDADVRDTAFAISRSAKNGRFIGSVFATLRANLRFLRYESIRESTVSSDFSLEVFRYKRGDAKHQPVALFLQFEERHQETTAQLLAATISHLFNWFIANTDRDPVLLMFDEVGNVPTIPGLVEKLNTIRSRKLPTWLYWQGIQQMQKYGNAAGEGPNSILAACDFHLAFRLNDNDTARWFSERIGTVDRRARSVSVGDSSSSRSVSMVEEPVLKVAELQALEPFETVAIYRGMVWRNWAVPWFERWEGKMK